jgi:putative copper export protein
VSSAYYLSVWLHIVAAFIWLGGMFFLGLVGAPVLREVEPGALRTELFRRLGERFRVVGWGSIGVLAVTGALNLRFRGLVRWESLGSPEFWDTRYGHLLAWKLALVVAMIGLSAVHDFALGPRASRLDPRTPEAAAARRWASWLGRLNAVLGLALIFAAIRMARG